MRLQSKGSASSGLVPLAPLVIASDDLCSRVFARQCWHLQNRSADKSVTAAASRLCIESVVEMECVGYSPVFEVLGKALMYSRQAWSALPVAVGARERHFLPTVTNQRTRM